MFGSIERSGLAGRHDPLLAVLVGKADPTGNDRVRQRDKGKALAGKSTLNRLELTPPGADADSRYKKIVASIRESWPQVRIVVRGDSGRRGRFDLRKTLVS